MRYRRAKALTLLLVVATLAMPRPVMACHGGTEFDRCCHAPAKAAPTVANCCHEESAGTETAALDCGAQNEPCFCCRPADPRSSSPERVANQLPSAATLAILTSVAFAPEASTVDSEQIAAFSDHPAIPHRIFHCSWLI